MEARILEERDTKRYIALRLQGANEHPRHTTVDLERELFLLTDYPARALSVHLSQGTVVWGVYDGTLLVGTIAISRRFNACVLNHLWLWGLYVRPRYRGTPVSRLLMEAVLRWCEDESDNDRLFSACALSNRNAKQFLDRWGFELAVNVFGWIHLEQTRSDVVLMERDRSSPLTLRT